MDQDATWYEGRPRPGNVVLDADPAPPPTGHSYFHQFSARVCCGQTTGWIKMPLGMELGLGPGDCVRCGPALPPKKGDSPSQFLAYVYYSYCDFVRTLQSRYWFVQVQVLVLYAFYF